MESRSELGAFLRARRELVRPEDAGLRPTGLRRVKGLRREEVALLAGISAEYYLRLEQGRDRHPSEQVLDAVARVLRLDAEATAYLRELGRSRPVRRPPAPADTVPAGLRMLLGTLNVPAFVVNRYRDVLAANALAGALSPLMVAGVNRLRALFTDPAARAFHPDWEQNAASLVAQLRAETVADPGDPRLAALAAGLSAESELFRTLWARHDVHRAAGASSIIDHPVLGRLDLRREKLLVPGTAGLQLVMYHAAPGSPAAEALARAPHLSQA